MSTDPTAGTTGQAAPDLMAALRKSIEDARENTARRELAEIGATLARFDFGGSYAFQVRQLAEERGRVLAENARLRQERNNYGAQIDELLAQSRPIESLIVQVVEAQGMLAKTGHAATPSSVPGVRDAYGRLTRIADGLRSVLGAIHGQEPDEFAREHPDALRTEAAAPPVLAVDTPVLLVDRPGESTPRLRVLGWWWATDDRASILLRLVPESASSATETAPQTVPGVTGHTEASTAPSAPAGGHWHVGRSWSGTDLEDTCPCPKEPCGLVDLTRAVPECTEHPAARAKSMRQVHAASECPGDPPPSGEGAALITATEQEIRDRLGGDDPQRHEDLIAQRDEWESTARTLARKVDERPTARGHNDDCGSCCCCSVDTDRLRTDLDNLRIALAETRSTAMRKIAAAEADAAALRVQASNYAHDRDEARRERDAAEEKARNLEAIYSTHQARLAEALGHDSANPPAMPLLVGQAGDIRREVLHLREAVVWPGPDAELQQRVRDLERQLAEARTEYRYGGWEALDEPTAHALLAEGKPVEYRTVHCGPWQPATQEAPQP